MAVTIQIFQARDNRWAYAPAIVRDDPAFCYEGQFDTGEQALAAAQADRSIPKGAKLVLEEAQPPKASDADIEAGYLAMARDDELEDLLALVRAARALVDSRPIELGDPQLLALAAALEQFEPWLEQDETPQSMGWVGKDGRP